MKILSVLVMACFLSACAFIQWSTTPNFNHYSTSGALKPGMKEVEVRTVLGSPKQVAARRTQFDTRSVWTYKRYYVDPGRYFVIGLATLGLGFLFSPANTEYHYLVFSDSVLLGWDLPDPYAPDLIIEKRER